MPKSPALDPGQGPAAPIGRPEAPSYWRALLDQLGIDPRWPWPLWLVGLLIVPGPRRAPTAGDSAAPAQALRFGAADLLRLAQQRGHISNAFEHPVSLSRT